MINKATLLGNIGQDPESRFTASGIHIVNISLATSRRWKDKQTGDKREETEWHRVVFIGRLAEIAAEYLKKGSKVYVEGRIHTNKWQDKDGNDRYTTEIIAAEMHMLDAAPNSGSDAGSQRTSPKQSGTASAPPRQAPPPPSNQYDDFDDDIPF